ncbi:MAG: DUF255 domain-containing protein [Chthoniobacterales bacterium]|nr:DUF255 domain-containing protein [Chthoniobacterales bacterium]
MNDGDVVRQLDYQSIADSASVFGRSADRGFELRNDEDFAPIVFFLPVVRELEGVDPARGADNNALRAAQEDAQAFVSFENPAIAKLMNDDFVSIKVDREERPDIDQVYMTFVQATTGSGGWPMTVFLTPDLKPFVGGTYFPPEDKYGRPGLASVLKKIAGA